MSQLPLPGMSPNEIVNVASVKHRSPFRYPGGKTWLVPKVYSWLHSKDEITETFIEPFAGGGIVGLSVAFERLARQVVLVELDDQVGAVWQTVLNDGNGLWLAEQILKFELTDINVDNLLASSEVSLKRKALQTIVKNRVNRGGILANGAGRLKYGENGKGIKSRWYPETLAKRIKDIVGISDYISFVQADGLTVIEENQSRKDVVFFVDPPYTASSKRPGSRLYDHSEINHARLFQILGDCSSDFLMTYDNVEEIREMAQHHSFDFEAVAMKNTHHAKMTELLIGKDLGWLRR